MTRVAWIVAAAAIVTGLGAAIVPYTESDIPQAHAQELAPAPVESALKIAPATPIAEKKAELGDDRTWNPVWDLWIETALPDDLLSPKVAKGVRPFCPRFVALSE